MLFLLMRYFDKKEITFYVSMNNVFVIQRENRRHVEAMVYLHTHR